MKSNRHYKMELSVKKLPDTISAAARHHNPIGCHHFFVLALPKEHKSLAWKTTRIGLIILLNRNLVLDIENQKLAAKKEKNHHAASSKFWQRVRSLNGAKSVVVNHLDYFKRRTF